MREEPIRRMAVVEHGLEARFLRRAYLEGAMRSDEWLAARARYHAIAPDEARRLGRLCADLRRDMAAFDRARER